MNIILTNAQCNQLEQMNSDLRTFPGKLRQSSQEFDQVLKTPVMMTWQEGTTAGSTAVTELRMNMNAIEQCCINVERICKANDQIIAWNRANNARTVRG